MGEKKGKTQESRIAGVGHKTQKNRPTMGQFDKVIGNDLLRTIKDGVWIEDEKGFCLLANDRTAETLGYDRAEVLEGKHWTEVVASDEHQHVKRQLIQRKANGHSTFQTLLQRKDGVTIPTLVSASSIYKRGAYRGSIALLVDYTEQEQFRDSMVQAERLRALGEMAMGVAHDFNNLLSAILGRAQLLKLHLSKYEGPERRKSTSYVIQGLALIEQAALDGAEIIRRIQDYTQTRGEEDYTRVDLNQLIRDVIELTKPRWKSKAEAEGIKVEIQEDRRHLPPVSGNPSELREVITNLVLNAIDAMPRGGNLTIRTKTDRRVDLIHIEDTGTGIPAQNLERVFQPFFTTKGSSSSGLGLSVSYGIIHRHGGSMQVKSKPGKGTTFTIQIPVSLEALDESEAERPPRPGRKARILVIDDEKRIRDNLEEILSLAGHTVTSAADARQAVGLFKRGTFDLVFTDLSMPEISGWEVARIIKKKDPGVPVALVTGWGVRIEPERLRDKGIDAVISKPFQMNRILNLVVEAVETKRAPRLHTKRADKGLA